MSEDEQPHAIWENFERELREKLVKQLERPREDEEPTSRPLPAASVFFIGLFTGVIGARVACACSIR